MSYVMSVLVYVSFLLIVSRTLQSLSPGSLLERPLRATDKCHMHACIVCVVTCYMCSRLRVPGCDVGPMCVANYELEHV
jgi:hypothetical protein